jgi:hypothetical protein
MNYVVEVVHMLNGDLVAARRLSASRERAGAFSAILAVGFLSVAVMVVAAMGVRVLGHSIYAPWFVSTWAATAVALSVLASLTVRRRVGRYVLGSKLDADAYAPANVDLVRRAGNRFELTLVPGMSGHIETGRVPMPIEALVADKPRVILLGEGATAQLSMGASTFVVRSRPEGATREVWFSREFFGLFSRAAVLGVQLAAVASLFAVVPKGETIGDRAARLVAPRITTPWEAEKWLRVEAQAQARSLHRCFDPLPVACQHPGYVGVGVSLSRDGEVRSNWIARSTYGDDCPVDECVKDVVSTWVFEPLPEAMRVVLPVQVLRTEKPLPLKVAMAPVRAVPQLPDPVSDSTSVGLE